MHSETGEAENEHRQLPVGPTPADLNFRRSWVLDWGYANFGGLRAGEVPRIYLPRTRVNKALAPILWTC
jgi:hypothetical protein